MSRPNITLAGLPIILHAGAPQQSYLQEAGWTDVRLSGGSLVRMAHWSKESITISGTGWMGLGFDAIDFSQPQELRCTQPKTITGTGLAYTLTSTPRPDVTPWAQALVGRQWVRAGSVANDLAVTVTPVPNAIAYRVSWMPVYVVLARPPAEALDASIAEFSWSFTAREV